MLLINPQTLFTFFSDPGYALHLIVMSPESPPIWINYVIFVFFEEYWPVMGLSDVSCWLNTLCIFGKKIMKWCYILFSAITYWGSWFWHVSSLTRLTYITWLRWFLPCFSTIKIFFLLFYHCTLILSSFGDACETQLLTGCFLNGGIQFWSLTLCVLCSTLRKSFPLPPFKFHFWK